MLIRPWQKDDNQKISSLEKECFSDAWSQEMIESAFSSPHFSGFVICENQEVLGYIGGQILFEQGEILLVAVDKNYRGNGFGKSLVNALIESFKDRGVEQLFLEVRVGNSVAISCYERCGFERIAVRKGYYADGEDAIIMEKKL
ncbi:MAG: ribosomal protein S18-alanine N-acetyltransferase [Clostridia bacterium]|nr:ribosomal protein S18-alanine N-acetyltransferase [Clostridia bacterium]